MLQECRKETSAHTKIDEKLGMAQKGKMNVTILSAKG
jgi:hypothetical protein